ncbi:MAG TPA: bifunctional hydroxymethylpyrimidine kinase/phosphomethylpyrimidine kinase, partial [Azospirillum sp.]|nr:bifunctional hydroxymethylpyrimidine kinase/phosphomethylpyrimidine kinase [Azospirillum sp.]
MKGRVLIVAGSDSGGGAGIQADIKAVSALNGFAMTAITALTAQNTLGVHGVYPIDPAFVAQQMRVVLEDIGA